MKFWQTYISKQKTEYLKACYPKNFRADLIAVIPCYDEPELRTTLESLLKCAPTKGNLLTAVIINSSVRCSENVIEQNRKTYQEVLHFAQQNNNKKISFFPLIFEKLPRKHAGVGLARKIGMDLSIVHFLNNNNPNGIIISLDADCKVSPNFLTAIEQSYQKNDKLCCTIQNFHHLPENKDQELENAIRQYEAHIRYFSRSLEIIGFPYYHHTIGSAFSVSARAYVKSGGMGRQQGGEDFYFLQKIFAFMQTRFLSDAYVFPSARFSDRIPFGTGPALQKILNNSEGKMMSYTFESFLQLKLLFNLKEFFYQNEIDEIEKKILSLHPAIAQFCLESDVLREIEDSKNNSASSHAFEKRFFHHFNAFKIIKFLNFSHEHHFKLSAVETEIKKQKDFLKISAY